MLLISKNSNLKSNVSLSKSLSIGIIKLNSSGENPNSCDAFKLTLPICQYELAVVLVDSKFIVQLSVIGGVKLKLLLFALLNSFEPVKVVKLWVK